VGQSVTFTATVTGNSPTGTIQFTDGAASLGAPVPLTGVTATLTLSTLSAGTHPIAAVYSVDSSNSKSTSAVLSEVVSNTNVAPQLRVIKHVVNSHGGTATAASFTMSVTGGSPASFAGSETGTVVTLTAGASYSVGGGAVTGYTQASAVGSCTGTLNVGDQKTCTITNTDIAPVLKVAKSLVPSTDTGKFNLTIDGTHFASAPNDPAGNGDATAFVPVSAGVQHTVGETAVLPALLTSYVTTYGAPCDASGHITLALGASATCTITNTLKGKAQVIKTVNAGSAPTPGNFTFELRTGADSSTSRGDPALETEPVNGTTGGTITFNTLLTPGIHYQICEQIVEPGWFTTLGPNSFALYNPGGTNIGERCVDFTVTAGQLITFNVNNFFLSTQGFGTSIGFWKDWASCAGSSGGQKPALDQTLAVSEALSPPPYGPGVAIGTLRLDGSVAIPNVALSCQPAVDLLNKSTIGAKPAKMASDPAFNMAAQLLAAILNVDAGAAICSNNEIVVNYADTLLAAHGFNGLTYTPFSPAEATLANTLATLLDTYNNSGPCPATLPTLPPIAPAVTSPNSFTFHIGTAASFIVTAQGGFPLTLSESGALPPGVTFTPVTGVLAYNGRSSLAGAYPITFTATNSTGGTTTQSFTPNMQ
jgi:hypothetical protein